MATYSRQDLIEWVMARMDELSSGSQVDVSSPSIFGRELDEATTQILSRARKELVYPAAVSKKTISCLVKMQVISSSLSLPVSVIIPLESDFRRFLRLKLSNWMFPIEEVVTSDSIEYKRQRNAYQGATSVLPLAAIVPYSATYDTDKACTMALEAFPAPGNTASTSEAVEGALGAYDMNGTTFWIDNASPATGKVALIEEFMVISRMAAESAPASLVDGIVWLASARCLTSLRTFDAAKIAFQMSESTLAGQLIGLKGENAMPAPQQGK